MSFRRKTYPEVADQLLNRLLGGVSGEPHAYPPPNSRREPHSHALEKGPAAEITSVHGLVDGVSTRFVKGGDYELSGDAAQLLWKAGGRRPDAGSVVEINYLPKQRETRINDLYPGSVVRTLMEAVALETAGLYAQMEAVYRAGFVDTAEGGALDHVVSLLGLARVRAGRNSAEARFSRARNSRGEITIPAGTRLLTADGGIEYETLSELTLADGQPSALVLARDLVESNDGLPADSLALLARPIVGIESVTNPAPTTRLDRDENDAELRARARSVLAGSERGTLGAIIAAIAEEGLLAEVADAAGAGAAGVVNILIHDDQLLPDRKARLEAKIKAVKPAGVWAAISYGASPRAVDLELRLATAPGMLETDLKRAQKEIRDRVTDYFAKLPGTENGSVSKLIGLAMGVSGVEDLTVVAATLDGSNVLDPARGVLDLADKTTRLGNLKLVDPALATQLMLLLRYTNDVALPDQGAIQAALQSAVAHLNAANARSGADPLLRTLSWGKLALATPLPGHAATPLADYDAQPGDFSPPLAADLQPYSLQYVFTRPTGVSQVVDSEAAPVLLLAELERLSLAKVALEVKPKDAQP